MGEEDEHDVRARFEAAQVELVELQRTLPRSQRRMVVANRVVGSLLAVVVLAWVLVVVRS